MTRGNAGKASGIHPLIDIYQYVAPIPLAWHGLCVMLSRSFRERRSEPVA